MEIHAFKQTEMVDVMGTLGTLETPFKRPKKKRVIATPQTFFIPRSRPQISPLQFDPSKIKGKLCVV